MTIDDNIKIVLEQINKEIFNPESSLPHLSRTELKNVVLMSEDEGYISYRSSKGKPLVQGFMGGGWMISPTAFVTRSGHQFLEGFDRNVSQPSQTFNVGSVYNSAVGNDNVVNNYSDTPIDDLKKYVSELANDEDKKEGNELVEALKNDEVKPGFLAKFDSFIEKHPKTIDLISSSLTSIAISGLSQ